MSIWSEMREHATALVRRDAEDRELEEELRFHLEQEAAQLIREGVEPGEARRRARLALGGVEQVREEVRVARGTLWLENLLRDVRLGWRSLRRSPVFAAVAVLTLAAGVGATTAVFGLVNALLIRPVPGVVRPHELAVVSYRDPSGSVAGISHANATDLAALTPALAGFVSHQGAALVAHTADGEPYRLRGTVVQGDYFGVLGVQPRHGRWFSQEEREPGAAGDVVVISWRFWRTHLDGGADVLGRTLRLNAQPYTIIGVAPPGFQGVGRTENADVWLPPAAYSRVRHGPFDAAERRRGLFTESIARLAPGASAEVLQEQLQTSMAELIERHPEENGIYGTHPPTVHPGVGLPVSIRERTSRTARLLLGIVSLLLVIACANVANLLVFRGLARRPEAAVRRALGASTGRVVQQPVVDGLLLSGIGGAAGIGLALLLTRLLQGQNLMSLPAIEQLDLDWRVLAFGLGSAMLAGLFATAAPAVLASRASLIRGVRSAAPTVARAGAALRGSLTVVQIAGSLALLVAALLLVQTVRGLYRVNVGFDADAVMVFGLDGEALGYDGAATDRLQRRLLEELEGVSGLESVAVASNMPFSRSNFLNRVRLPGSESEPTMVMSYSVSPEYFATTGIPLLRGRSFTTDEMYQPEIARPGVILSAAAAEALFGTTEPGPGETVEVRGLSGYIRQPVLGITGSTRILNLRGAPDMIVYLPLGAAPPFQQTRYILTRAQLPPAQVESLVRGVLAGIDPALPFFRVEVLEETIRQSVAEERLLARLLAIFALLAAGLAGIGLYGVISYSVAQRRRELGIRIALGARPAGVMALVAAQTQRLVLIGAVIGAAGGYALSQLLASRLFAVAALDPLTYVAAIAGFGLIGLAATALPARSAASVDPVLTLKAE